MGMILLPIVLLSLAVMGADKERTAEAAQRVKPFARFMGIAAILILAIFIIPPLIGWQRLP